MAIEQQLAQLAIQKDKALSDKVLARHNIERINQIIRSSALTREDLLELLYRLTSDEVKLAKLSEYDRYLLGKFYTWIRDFVVIGENIFDIEEKYNNLYAKTKKDTYVSILKSVENIKNNLSHTIKFLVDLYLYILRSSLSLDAHAFNEILKNKFEYSYTGLNQTGEMKK